MAVPTSPWPVDDKLVRTDDGWKIAERVQTVLWTDGNAAVLAL